MMLRHVGTTFAVRATAMQRVDLRLTAVRDLSNPRAKARPDQCFSCLFEGPGNAGFAQGTYLLDHQVLGTVALFLAPVNLRTPGSPVTYEALVNRLA